MPSSFRTTKWDPLLILSQIAALQSLCYILLSLIITIALTLNGTDLSLDLIFNDKEIRTDTGFGWSLIFVWIVNAFVSIPLLMVIVQRAKQILDFVLTFHFFHLLISWKTSHHFPTGTAWWVLQVVNIAIMTLGGEWACMHREMKPILTTGGQKKSKTSMSHDPVASTSQSLDTMSEEMGKRLKRKVSDAEQKEEDDDTDTHVDHQQGALLAAVGKAKKAIISNNSRPKRHGKQKYDQIPLDELDNDNSSSMIK